MNKNCCYFFSNPNVVQHEAQVFRIIKSVYGFFYQSECSASSPSFNRAIKVLSLLSYFAHFIHLPLRFLLSSLTPLYAIFYPCHLLQVHSVPLLWKTSFLWLPFTYFFNFLPLQAPPLLPSIFYITLPRTYSVLSRTQASERGIKK